MTESFLTEEAKKDIQDMLDINGGSGGGTSDYEDLDNKPQINNVELTGNKTLQQIGAASATDVSGLETRVGTAEGNITSLSSSVTSLGTRVGQAESDIDSLESQFNTAVSAVTTDTEVTNIRVGADGTTYATAGEAVRSQVADLKSALTADEYSIEPFVKSDWEQGTYNSGGYKTNSDYRIRMKDKQVAEKSFKIQNRKGYTICIFKFNSDGSYNSNTGYPSDDTITEYSINKDDVFCLVISKYPSAATTTNNYNCINYFGLTKYDHTVLLTDAISQDIEFLQEQIKLFTKDDFEIGTLNTTTGTKNDTQYRIRLKNLYRAPFSFSITNKTGYNFGIFRYNDNLTLESTTGLPTNSTQQTLSITKGELVGIVVYKYPFVQAATSDVDGIIITGETRFDRIDSIINNNSKVNEIVSNATFFETADVSYLTTKYYVGKNRDYQTISEALSAWQNANYPPAVVYIENGEYNETVFVDSGKTIAFVGESKDGVIIRTKTGAYTDPPIFIRHGTVLIENLTAIADHSENPDFVYVSGNTMAYAFHIDGGSVGDTVVIRNCRAVSYQSPAFGMGLIPNSKIRLEDVEAYAYTDDTTDSSVSLNYGSILCHLPSPTTYPSQSADDDDIIELINVKAYAKNSDKVIYFTSSSGTVSSMTICAINTIAASGKTTDTDSMIKMLGNCVIDELSSGNNIAILNS